MDKLKELENWLFELFCLARPDYAQDGTSECHYWGIKNFIFEQQKKVELETLIRKYVNHEISGKEEERLIELNNQLPEEKQYKLKSVLKRLVEKGEKLLGAEQRLITIKTADFVIELRINKKEREEMIHKLLTGENLIIIDKSLKEE